MQRPLLHLVRAHGGPAAVVALLLAMLVSPVLRAGAQASPVDPVPVGVWPLQPRPQVVRAFDPPTRPWGAGHRGVDLVGRVGAQVHAALAGVVRFAGRIAGRGVVVVGHGSTRTTYEPIAAVVRVGEAVARGQPIGTLELSGSHCLPSACLHWGWLRADTYLDPLLLVGGGPVRLLPLWRGPPAPAMPLPVAIQPFAVLTAPLLRATTPLTRHAEASPLSTQRVRLPVTMPTRSCAMRPLLL